MNRRTPLLAVALLGGLVALSQSAVGQSVSSSIARALRTSSGTVLTVGAVSDGQVLTRSGTSIIGSAASGGNPAGAAYTVSAEASASTRVGYVYDLCDEPDDANLLSGADAGTTWVSTNLTSAARASGVITVVHSTTTDGGSSRQDGTQPAVTFDHTPLAGRLIVHGNVGTDGNYYILNPFLRHPGGGNAYYGLQVFNGTLEAWYGSTRGTASTTTTSDRWYAVEWAGNTARLFWSSSASEPTAYSSSAASGWAFLDAFTISDPSSGSRPLVGVGFWHFTGSASVTYTIRTLRLEAL